MSSILGVEAPSVLYISGAISSYKELLKLIAEEYSAEETFGLSFSAANISTNRRFRTKSSRADYPIFVSLPIRSELYFNAIHFGTILPHELFIRSSRQKERE